MITRVITQKSINILDLFMVNNKQQKTIRSIMFIYFNDVIWQLAKTNTKSELKKFWMWFCECEFDDLIKMTQDEYAAVQFIYSNKKSALKYKSIYEQLEKQINGIA